MNTQKVNYTIDAAALIQDLRRYTEATGKEWNPRKVERQIGIYSAAAPFIGIAYEAGLKGEPLQEALPWMTTEEE